MSKYSDYYSGEGEGDIQITLPLEGDVLKGDPIQLIDGKFSKAVGEYDNNASLAPPNQQDFALNMNSTRVLQYNGFIYVLGRNSNNNLIFHIGALNEATKSINWVVKDRLLDIATITSITETRIVPLPVGDGVIFSAVMTRNNITKLRLYSIRPWETDPTSPNYLNTNTSTTEMDVPRNNVYDLKSYPDLSRAYLLMQNSILIQGRTISISGSTALMSLGTVYNFTSDRYMNSLALEYIPSNSDVGRNTSFFVVTGNPETSDKRVLFMHIADNYTGAVKGFYQASTAVVNGTHELKYNPTTDTLFHFNALGVNAFIPRNSTSDQVAIAGSTAAFGSSQNRDLSSQDSAFYSRYTVSATIGFNKLGFERTGSSITFTRTDQFVGTPNINNSSTLWTFFWANGLLGGLFTPDNVNIYSTYFSLRTPLTDSIEIFGFASEDTSGGSELTVTPKFDSRQLYYTDQVLQPFAVYQTTYETGRLALESETVAEDSIIKDKVKAITTNAFIIGYRDDS